MCKKRVEDIDVDTIDLAKHEVTIYAGTKLYRIVPKGIDPLKPTGKASRFAKELPGYSREKYALAYNLGHAVLFGTSAVCLSFTPATALLEIGGNNAASDTFEIILKEDIKIINMDSICEAENVSKPYITDERSEVWHQFYGRGVTGLKHESAKNPKDYNLVVFPDNFPKFLKIVIVKKL